ncbi:outer membrane lipoprotein carrier protein LolA [bacterium]|nr:outer membrane lipoprotein carrier protein LolA [bacterium]
MTRVNGKARPTWSPGSRAALLAALGLVGLVATARADDVPADARAFLKAWAERMRGVRSLRVEFDQTKELRILKRPLVSHGVACLKGKKLLMVVSKDGERETELQVDVEKGEARLHYPKLKRVEVVEIGKGAQTPASAPFPIFGGDVEALPETYSVKLEKETDGAERDVLVLTPRERKGAAEMRMFFDKGEISEVRQVDAKGDKVRVVVKKFEKNPELDDAAVALEVPEGTKVVPMFGRADEAPVSTTSR